MISANEALDNTWKNIEVRYEEEMSEIIDAINSSTTRIAKINIFKWDDETINEIIEYLEFKEYKINHKWVGCDINMFATARTMTISW